MQIPERLKSRKFWMTIIAIVVNFVSFQSSPETGQELHLVLIALMDAMVAAYVFAQGKVDAEKEKQKALYPEYRNERQ